MPSAGNLHYPALALAALLLSGTMPLGAQTLHARPAEQARPVQPAAAPQTPAEKTPPAHLILPMGTSMQVQVSHRYPMKDGETIQGRLVYPIYVAGRLAVPKDTVIYGKVIGLDANRRMRWRGRLRGDFTPFHAARVQFDRLRLKADDLPIAATTASNGAPLVQLTAAGAGPRHAFVRRQIAQAKSQLRDRIEWFIAPGFRDRALEMLYHQLPYHPEQIAAHTAWSFELTSPLTLPGKPAPVTDPEPVAANNGKPEIWTVEALLVRQLTSARAHPGDPVNAVVVQPVYDSDKQLVVPEGSTLIGRVTAATPARSFGRNGKLRFTFQQVRFPKGFGTAVQGSLSGASAAKTQDLQISAEGTVTPKNKASAVAPMLLTLLAGRALDQDGNVTTNTTVASNGFGLVGRIVGIAAGAPNLAAGIGFYAASLSFYDNFLHSGRDVIFPKDTRIEIVTTPLRAPVLKP